MHIDVTWKEIATVMATTAVIFASTAAGLAAAWRRERERRIAAEDELWARRNAGAMSDASTLVGIRNTVEQLALELERLGEMERFAMSRLAERLPERVPDRDYRRAASTTPVPRTSTPH